MPNVQDKLAALLRSEKVRTLAQYAPIGLVAVVSGGVIGIAVGAPAFATAGLGLVLTGLATNLTSSLLYDAVRPDADDDTRSIAIQRALETDDPRIKALVSMLVADSLTALGPQLAHSLADAQQSALLPALSDGMRRSGGVLAEVEPQLSAALADPQANWAALQQQVAQKISSLEMSIEAGDDTRVAENKMRAENVTGPVKMSINASGKAVVERNEQTAIGAGGAPASPPSQPSAPNTPSDPQHLRALLAATIARLEVRELQRAQFGIEAPPHVVTELGDLRAEVARLQQLVGA